MAAIGSLLMNKVSGHSDAEKEFRPWWDTPALKLKSLLVRENMLGGVKAAVTESGAAVCQTANADGGREAIELRLSFNYFGSYFIRTVLKLIVAFLLLIYICTDGLSILKYADNIICDVYG